MTKILWWITVRLTDDKKTVGRKRKTSTSGRTISGILQFFIFGISATLSSTFWGKQMPVTMHRCMALWRLVHWPSTAGSLHLVQRRRVNTRMCVPNVIRYWTMKTQRSRQIPKNGVDNGRSRVGNGDMSSPLGAECLDGEIVCSSSKSADGRFGISVQVSSMRDRNHSFL